MSEAVLVSDHGRAWRVVPFTSSWRQERRVLGTMGILLLAVASVAFASDEGAPKGTQEGVQGVSVGGARRLQAATKCADVNFDGIPAGTIIDRLELGFGITGDPIAGTIGVKAISTQGRERKRDTSCAANRAMIFDTNCHNGVGPRRCSGRDNDLATGGDTGIPALNEVLIASEDCDTTDPDDIVGAKFEVDFTQFGPRGVATLDVVQVMDAEESGGLIYCEDGLGNRLFNQANTANQFPIPQSGRDGQLTVVPMDVVDCAVLVVEMAGSGAIDLAEICVDSMGFGADPVVIGPHRTKTQFWMPLGQFVPVFASGVVEIFLRAFGKPGTHAQWIDGVVVKENGRITVDVVVTRDNDLLQGSRGERRVADDERLAFLEAKVDGVVVDAVGDHPYRSSRGSATVQLAKHDYPILGTRGDAVTVSTDALTLELFTMPARKYRDEAEAARYTHIDFQVATVRDRDQATGFLSDVMFGTDTVDPALKEAWLRRPPALESPDYVVELPEVLADKTYIVFS